MLFVSGKNKGGELLGLVTCPCKNFRITLILAEHFAVHFVSLCLCLVNYAVFLSIGVIDDFLCFFLFGNNAVLCVLDDFSSLFLCVGNQLISLCLRFGKKLLALLLCAEQCVLEGVLVFTIFTNFVSKHLKLFLKVAVFFLKLCEFNGNIP